MAPRQRARPRTRPLDRLGVMAHVRAVAHADAAVSSLGSTIRPCPLVAQVAHLFVHSRPPAWDEPSNWSVLYHTEHFPQAMAPPLPLPLCRRSTRRLRVSGTARRAAHAPRRRTCLMGHILVQDEFQAARMRRCFGRNELR